MELRIGIDASINATGFVLMLKNGHQIVETDYYLIVPRNQAVTEVSNEFTATGRRRKKPKKMFSDSATILKYDRYYQTKESTYSQQDIYKIMSAEKLAELIVNKIEDKIADNPELTKVSCRIEGALMSSFSGATGRVNDLVAFSSVMKYCLIKANILSELSIVLPKTLKRLATGNGAAKKTQLIVVHKEKYGHDTFDYSGKIDDLIDAFMLYII
jgi:hypothetical protein